MEKRGGRLCNYMVTNQCTSEKKTRNKKQNQKQLKVKEIENCGRRGLTSKEGGGMGCKEEKAKIGWNP